ncbi:MAG: type II toxin-antitoxin system RelE/ParE family toxin [Planctomycetia bacterium]
MFVRGAAEQDLAEARDWYESQRTGLGFEFIADFQRSLVEIERFPESFTPVRKTIRRLQMNRFPYVVFFQIQTERIEVFAVVHMRRRPNTWRSRM